MRRRGGEAARRRRGVPARREIVYRVSMCWGEGGGEGGYA